MKINNANWGLFSVSISPQLHFFGTSFLKVTAQLSYLTNVIYVNRHLSILKKNKLFEM